MVAAILDEQQSLAIGRPFEPRYLARHARQPVRTRRFAPQPDFAFADKGKPRAVARENRRMAFADQGRLPACGREDEQALLGRRRLRRDIGCGPVGIFGIAALHEGDRRAVASQREIGQLLPVILCKSGDCACALSRRRDPEVARAGGIFDPGETGGILRADQPTGDRKSKRLGEIVGARRLCCEQGAKPEA